MLRLFYVCILSYHIQRGTEIWVHKKNDSLNHKMNSQKRGEKKRSSALQMSTFCLTAYISMHVTGSSVGQQSTCKR